MKIRGIFGVFSGLLKLILRRKPAKVEKPVTESEFMVQVDETLQRIEEILDEAESDLDYETNGGMMTVKCENGSQIIFTRQPPLKQLWLALPGGGFHFDYDLDSGQWKRDSDGASLNDMLGKAFAEQAGEQFDFSAI